VAQIFIRHLLFFHVFLFYEILDTKIQEDPFQQEQVNRNVIKEIFLPKKDRLN